MKNEFVEYLEFLGVTPVVSERVAKVLEIYSQLFKKLDVREIFLSEDVNREKEREWRSLILFTDNYILEAKNFLSHTDLEITYVINSIDYMRMRFRDYEPGKPTTAESRFRVEGYFLSEIDFELNASDKNCDKLWGICQNVLMPNWAAKPDGGNRNANPKPQRAGQ